VVGVLDVTHKVRVRLGRIDIIRKEADGWISAVSLSLFRIRYCSWSLRGGKFLVRESYRERRIPFKLYLKILKALIHRRFSEIFVYALFVSHGIYYDGMY
jgi:hypothetical protein